MIREALQEGKEEPLAKSEALMAMTLLGGMIVTTTVTTAAHAIKNRDTDMLRRSLEIVVPAAAATYLSGRAAYSSLRRRGFVARDYSERMQQEAASLEAAPAKPSNKAIEPTYF